MFTPFETEFDQLQAIDLERLRETTEGWYVEYKRDLPNASVIAKSISALANTYGGWLFIGVGEASKGNAVAGSFPGLAVASANAALQCIRQAVADHMNPPAHFDARAITGGDDASFSADRVVVCIRVPQSLAGPHVHRNGQIYRRVGEGSEPRPENDRHMLDQLFRRADELKKDYSDWHDRDPEFSKREEEVPYLRLMLMVDPWQQEDPWLDLKTAELSAVFNQSPLMSSVPFDAVHTSGRGYLARQISTNDPHSLGLTWQLRRSLNSDVIVPLRFSDGDNGGSADNFLRGYKTAPRFLRMLHEGNYRSPRIVDLNMIYNLLIAIVELQHRILARANWSKPYYVKVRLLNVWRTVPYLDIPEVLDQFNDHGLPMCMDSAVTSPLGREPDSFAEIPSLNELGEADKIIWQAMSIFSHIVHPWGVPMLLSEDAGKFLKSLTAAGKAFMSVQEGTSETPTVS